MNIDTFLEVPVGPITGNRMDDANRAQAVIFFTDRLGEPACYRQLGRENWTIQRPDTRIAKGPINIPPTSARILLNWMISRRDMAGFSSDPRPTDLERIAKFLKPIADLEAMA